MNTCTVNAHLFRAALTFAGVADVRYYLNSVRVEPAPNGGVLLIATDGHRIAVIHDEAGTTDGSFIIARHKRLALKKRTKRSAPETVTFDGATATYSDGVVVPCAYIDARYPDWRSVMPLTPMKPGGLVNVNPEFIGDCAAICAAFGLEWAGVTIASADADRTMLVTFGDLPAFVAVMPLRMVGDATNLPAFMHSRPARKEAA